MYMRKIILSALMLASMIFSVNATVYMNVKSVGGKTDKFDVEEVKEVIYVEESVVLTQDTAGSGIQGVSVSGKTGGYTYVDLGLSSGTMWATYNVGASSPKEYGSYFAWGETETKEEYGYNNYKWGYNIGSFIKYNSEDLKSILDPDDDAATANWGGAWRTPTQEERSELSSGCDWEWVSDFNGSGISGLKGISKRNGKSIFFPAAGVKEDNSLYEDGERGYYWSSALNNLSESESFQITSSNFETKSNGRCWGLSVRAVTSTKILYMCVKCADGSVTKFDMHDIVEIKYEEFSEEYGITISGKIGNYDYVDLGLPSGLKWATYNVGASTPLEYGGYYAWGETSQKRDYSQETYIWFEGSYTNVTKYRMAGMSLTLSDDAAAANWGESWRMPTPVELQELVDNCTWEKVNKFKGSMINGWLGTSKTNGNVIFLPAGGMGNGEFSNYKGDKLFYWSSTMGSYTYTITETLDVKDLKELNNKLKMDNSYRYYGESVRAVSE